MDPTQPIVLYQEPPPHAKILLRTHDVKLAYEPIDGVLHWVLCLPLACRVTEHLRYRSIVQYHVRFLDAFSFTLCTNTDAETGEEYNVVVVPLYHV